MAALQGQVAALHALLGSEMDSATEAVKGHLAASEAALEDFGSEEAAHSAAVSQVLEGAVKRAAETLAEVQGHLAEQQMAVGEFVAQQQEVRHGLPLRPPSAHVSSSRACPLFPHQLVAQLEAASCHPLSA
eukprot:jgi/Mesen1/11060/ME000099S10505